jgi:hypothetical protein
MYKNYEDFDRDWFSDILVMLAIGGAAIVAGIGFVVFSLIWVAHCLFSRPERKQSHVPLKVYGPDPDDIVDIYPEVKIQVQSVSQERMERMGLR